MGKYVVSDEGEGLTWITERERKGNALAQSLTEATGIVHYYNDSWRSLECNTTDAFIGYDAERSRLYFIRYTGAKEFLTYRPNELPDPEQFRSTVSEIAAAHSLKVRHDIRKVETWEQKVRDSWSS